MTRNQFVMFLLAIVALASCSPSAKSDAPQAESVISETMPATLDGTAEITDMDRTRFLNFAMTHVFEGDKETRSFLKAMVDGNLSRLEKLARSGYRFDQNGRDGCTPFHIYATRFPKHKLDLKVLKKMLELGADPLAICRLGETQTPLTAHTYYGTPQTLSVFLDYGISPDTYHPVFKEPLLMCAITGENEQNIELLLERGADINLISKKSSHGYHSPFTQAIARGNYPLALKLVEIGANPRHNPRDSYSLPYNLRVASPPKKGSEAFLYRNLLIKWLYENEGIIIGPFLPHMNLRAYFELEEEENADLKKMGFKIHPHFNAPIRKDWEEVKARE